MNKSAKLLWVAVLVLAIAGCGGLRSGHSTLPERAVRHIEACGQKDNVLSTVYGKCDHGRLYSYIFELPRRCWTVVTADSVQMVYDGKGVWLYSVVLRWADDLGIKYFSDIPNADRMIQYLYAKSSDIHIVGVIRDTDRWIIAAYETHGRYYGYPRYYYFRSDGSSCGCKIIA